jgi:hypothetical protein
MRTSVFGAVGLLCFGALFLGTSGGRELVVAVVVVGPALTVLVAVAADEVAAVDVALVVELAELEEWPEPPQAAMSSEASTAAQNACRDIGAL